MNEIVVLFQNKSQSNVLDHQLSDNRHQKELLAESPEEDG